MMTMLLLISYYIIISIIVINNLDYVINFFIKDNKRPPLVFYIDRQAVKVTVLDKARGPNKSEMIIIGPYAY